ncbi:glycoside hydrolase family 15 protein [Ephemerocybe angulata]|uniref:Glycoside hydrolase family 15 protein n=1 Tax=Ephemerocybe angulata TaxID=980116 RepID=A0A8H6HML1_9AGAR|nr:glycoside hydrolase family 15 protein [Tulosesus angulatus]
MAERSDPPRTDSQARQYHPSDERDYIPLGDHGLIGNLRTAALVSLDGSIESYCVPHFDSPSVFARILDKDKGGHFSITPMIPFTTKQNYLPSSNVLQTKFMNDEGVVSVTDFLPRPPMSGSSPSKPLLQWLIRRVECVRGGLPMQMQCAPAFNYALDAHITTLIDDDTIPTDALFESPSISMDLRYVTYTESAGDGDEDGPPNVVLNLLDLSKKGHKGMGVASEFELKEGQGVTFIFRIVPGSPDTSGFWLEQTPANTVPPTPDVEVKQPTFGFSAPSKDSQGLKVDTNVVVPHEDDKGFAAGVAFGKKLSRRAARAGKRPTDDPWLTKELLCKLLSTTNRYWYDWIRKSTYTGSWKESVLRSALALKLLIFEPTGAVVASPTFSLPEYIGGVRNWDYRFSWIRDSSFTLYALIRLGFVDEANAYLEFIFARIRDKNPDGSIQIMYTIHGEKDMEEIELDHLDGHKGSKPVRIGNGASDHVQLDIYGELMDCIYLGQKFGKPLAYDDWVLVREIVDYVVEHYNDSDLSIWEVRDMKRNFTYSKVMLWVAIDRGLRLAEKRSLPCPNRNKWLVARDTLYEDIMNKAWNKEEKFFGQSYEETDVLDAAVLIMPLVFFMQASDPRFLSTLKRIMKSPEKGGLMANNLVYRYDTKKSGDGVGGEEGTFCLCTLWCVEALTRAGNTDRALLLKSVSMFEDFLLYLNHVGLCTEEISDAGEALGNAVQGFTHVTLISAAYNLSRTMHDMHEKSA